MSKKHFIHCVHSLLQNKSNWYIEALASDENEEIKDIAEKAKIEADYALPDISEAALYGRYQRWLKTPRMTVRDEESSQSIDDFLNDLVFSLGMAGLTKDERPIFEESCYLVLRFL